MSVGTNIQTVNFNNNIQPKMQTNFKAQSSSVKDYPPDTVEISGKKKAGMSTGAKFGIGIGLASIIGLGVELIWGKGKHLKSLWEKISGKGVNSANSLDEGKKYLDKIDDIRENFSKIFARDYTKDEAQELALKYKEIFETEDNSKFLQKILERLKKDYSLPDFKMSLGKKTHSQEYASWGIFTGGIEYNIDLIKYNADGIITELDRPNMIMSLTHELKHAAQDKIANQIDIHKHIMARIDFEQSHNTIAWQKALRKYGSNIEEVREKLAKECYDAMIPSFKNLEKISENSPLYQKGLEYIEGHKNYIRYQDDLVGYKKQLIEKEAFDAGDRMEQIYKWLINK